MSFRDRILKDIASHGCSVIGVFGEQGKPPFAYTIGLTATYGFELLVIGLNGEVATMIFNDIVASLQAYETLELNVPDNRWANLPVMFKEANSKAHDYVHQADGFYGKQVRVLQMVLSDRQGLLPSHPDFDHAHMAPRQALLYNWEPE